MKKKNDYPVDVATFLINLQPVGFVKDLSFLNLPLQMSGDSVRQDFFSPESIVKLKDLSTVNFMDPIEVRNRTICLFNYDLASRIGETLLIELQDLREDSDGDRSVVLRTDVQKGTKPECVLRLFFEETITMLKEYLKIRHQFNPKCSGLFIANTGGPWNEDTCRKQMEDHCEKLGMRTFYGKRGTPHDLRRAFATLNIEPLGLKLPLDAIVRRLRHVKYETAKRHYVINNPYVDKLEHNYYKNGAKKKTSSEILNEVPLADLEHWLSDDIGVDPGLIVAIRHRHKKASVKASGKGADGVVYISESQALDRLSKLSISAVPLRQYAAGKGACQTDGKQSLRYDHSFRYKEDFIDNLANNWIAANDLMDKLKMTSTDFYRSLERKGWRNIKIGRSRYVCKADCL